MKRIALVSSEPIRPAMAGIGIRYLELARRLPAAAGGGVTTVLVTPGDPEAAREALAAADRDESRGRGRREAPGAVGALEKSREAPGSVGALEKSREAPGAVGALEEIRRFERGRLAEALAGCDGAVAQGQLANDLLLELPELPVAIDLYDPWLVENLHYTESLGLDPYRNDHATWVLQLSRGDFFLCSSEEQRTFYLGFLAALGRVNPERVATDPDLAGLIAPVPFGLPRELPPHRPYLPPPRPGERRLLFGGLYDWYDPFTLLDALERLEGTDWTLLLIANPNPGSTPQRLLGEVEERARRRGWWENRVRLLDWVPAGRRWDLLREVDLVVAPHRPSLETRLALRTRFLDALAAGRPVVATEGGALGRLLAHHRAGWLVPPGDPAALAGALVEALAAGAAPAGAQDLIAEFAWDRVLAPLAAFCLDPRTDPTKERYAFRPPTLAPPDRLGFRLRRWWRRRSGGGPDRGEARGEGGG